MIKLNLVTWWQSLDGEKSGTEEEDKNSFNPKISSSPNDKTKRSQQKGGKWMEKKRNAQKFSLNVTCVITK